MKTIFSCCLLIFIGNTAFAATAYFNPTVTQSNMNRDYDTCKIEGLSKVPVDRLNGYDNNFDLRQNVIGRCMAKKGYQEVQVRTCGPFKKVPDMNKPAKITSKTCVLGKGRFYAFVTP